MSKSLNLTKLIKSMMQEKYIKWTVSTVPDLIIIGWRAPLWEILDPLLFQDSYICLLISSLVLSFWFQSVGISCGQKITWIPLIITPPGGVFHVLSNSCFYKASSKIVVSISNLWAFFTVWKKIQFSWSVQTCSTFRFCFAVVFFCFCL